VLANARLGDSTRAIATFVPKDRALTALKIQPFV